MISGERPYKIAAIIVLVLVFIISWSSHSTTKTMQQQVQSLQNEMNSLRNQFSQEIGSITGTVRSMRDDARWYTAPRFEITEVEEEKVTVRLSWSLREYTEGSTVTISYRLSDEASFNAAAAEEEADGLFYVEVALDLPREPQWNISTTKPPQGDASEPNRSSTSAIREEKAWGAYPNLQLEYYISLQDGDTKRVSDRKSMEVGKLGHNLFNPLDLNVRWVSTEQVHVTLYELKSGEPHYTFEAAYLESRRGAETVERWKLEPEQLPEGAPQPEPHLALLDVMAKPEQDYESLFVVVQYSQGVTVEKELTDL